VQIRTKELDLKSDSKREAFLRSYGDVLYRRTREWKRNLLHSECPYFAVSGRNPDVVRVTRLGIYREWMQG
jgi:hypothetical protein